LSPGQRSSWQPRQRPQPVIVLVDGRTASAAEVLAATLADRGRALVVGARRSARAWCRRSPPSPMVASCSSPGAACWRRAAGLSRALACSRRSAPVSASMRWRDSCRRWHPASSRWRRRSNALEISAPRFHRPRSGNPQRLPGSRGSRIGSGCCPFPDREPGRLRRGTAAAYAIICAATRRCVVSH